MKGLRKMKKLLAILLAVMLVCVSFAACSKNAENNTKETTTEATASDLAYVQEKGKLIVGITDYAPMDYKEDGSDEWTGFDAELARVVGEKLGVEVEFLEIEWSPSQTYRRRQHRCAPQKQGSVFVLGNCKG